MNNRRLLAFFRYAPDGAPAGGTNQTQNPTSAPAPTSEGEGVKTADSEGAETSTASTEGAENPTGSTSADATNPTQPDGQDNQDKVFTQTELDQKVEERLAIEKRRAATREANARAEAERKAKEEQGEFQTLYQTERTRAETAEARVAELERQIMVDRIVGEFSLDADLKERLRGEDEAGLRADAKKLAAFRKVPKAPPSDAGAGNRPMAPKAPPSNGNPNAANPAPPTPNYAFTRPDEVKIPF